MIVLPAQGMKKGLYVIVLASEAIPARENTIFIRED